MAQSLPSICQYIEKGLSAKHLSDLCRITVGYMVVLQIPEEEVDGIYGSLDEFKLLSSRINIHKNWVAFRLTLFVYLFVCISVRLSFCLPILCVCLSDAYSWRWRRSQVVSGNVHGH